tara:strand:- start:537 stop:881 length:345 start_codon:yes stop_codon:yes gene_type:complete
MAAANLRDGKSKGLRMTELRLDNVTETLAGGKTLTVNSPTLQMLDPGGSARTVVLPAEADSDGLVFIISNEADAAEIITVDDDAGAAIVTPTQNEAAIVWCDGTSWAGMVGATS